MNQTWIAFSLIASFLAPSRPFPVQFVTNVTGKTVTICLDGHKIEKTFAGKLGFRDRTHSWASFCCDVRAPIMAGQYTPMRARDSRFYGGRVAMAGNIVANNFEKASTPEKAAALQLAIWEALEDGGKRADFSSGRFQARSDPGVIAQAQAYYTFAMTKKSAVVLESPGRKSQSQISIDGREAIPPGSGVGK